MRDFKEQMKNPQIEYKEKILNIKQRRGKPYILPQDSWSLNLWEGISYKAIKHFAQSEIAWHKWKHNLLSSQIMCVNLFFPLKEHLDVLKSWLLSEFPDVEKVTNLDFEYIGPEGKDYFKEGGGRGQNRTSSDISITWLDEAGRGNMLLLEFKFTEPNFGNCSQKYNHNPERCLLPNKVVSSPQTECYKAEVGRTYWDIILSDESPLRKERLTTERYYCPFRYDFYQLMRNQLLAHCIQSDSDADFNKVDFGVIYHADNNDLLRMSHTFGGESNPLKAWPSLLKNQETFHTFTVQDFLGTIEASLPDDLKGWRIYIEQRYGL